MNNNESEVVEMGSESDNATIHSNADDNEGGIPIKNEHPSSKMNRIFINLGIESSHEVKNGDHYFVLSETDVGNEFFENVRLYLDKNKYAIICPDDDLFQIISEVYRKKLNKRTPN